MSDETLRLWMSDLSERIERMGKSIRSELADIRSLLHSPNDCPVRTTAEGCSKRIGKVEKRLNERVTIGRKRSWDVFKELVKSVLMVAGAVIISWLLFVFGLR